jgi:putative RNA 2'-phosphotransferase
VPRAAVPSEDAVIDVAELVHGHASSACLCTSSATFSSAVVSVALPPEGEDGDVAEHLGKLLALVLRHRPGVAGVTLDPAGWVDVDELVTGLRRTGRRITADDVRRAVDADSKGRYELVAGRIRAAQGHSVEVELGLPPVLPPDVLYHGTVERNVASILAAGLRPGSRQSVHLSADVATARVVGRRRGEPVVLVVDAAGAHAAGHEFRRASNGVWLTDAVPPRYLRRLS